MGLAEDDLAPQPETDDRIYLAQVSSSSAADVIDNVHSDTTGQYTINGRTFRRRLLEDKHGPVERYYHNDGDEEDGSADENEYHYGDDTSVSDDEFILDDFEVMKANDTIKQDDAHFVNGRGDTFFRPTNAGETEHFGGAHGGDRRHVTEYYYGPEDSIDTDSDVTEGANEKSINFTDRWIPAEQRLMYDLLWSYERAVRPVVNASATVHVYLDLTVTQIFDMVTITHASGHTHTSLLPFIIVVTIITIIIPTGIMKGGDNMRFLKCHKNKDDTSLLLPV